MDSSMSTAYQSHIKSADKAAEIRDTIIELYGKYTNLTVTKACIDGIITQDELKLLRRNTKL